MRWASFVYVGSACLCACLSLTACGNKVEEPLDPAPVAQLQGAWRMVNRASSCETRYAVFSPLGVHRLNADGSRKQYFVIRKFLLDAGKFNLVVAGLAEHPADEFEMRFTLGAGQIRLVDLRGADGASWRDPPAKLEPAVRASMANFFAINEQHFAMDRCDGN